MRLVLSAALLLATLPAQAEDGADCYSVGGDLSAAVAVARVIPPKLNFVKGAADAPGCPSALDACRARAYLQEGDVVLTGRRFREFVCASYVNVKGRTTTGWLPAPHVEPMPPRDRVTTADWAGTWIRTEAEIKIRAEGRNLSIIGEATLGSNNPDWVARGNVRTGNFDATVTPTGTTLAFADDGNAAFDDPAATCAVRMRRVDRYLMVEDNAGCGGLGVSFTGLYARK